MHIATIIIIIENILLFTIPLILWLTGFEHPFSPQLHRLLHILGVVLFLGNIIVTGIWMFLATRTKNQQIIHFSAKATHWMDVFFTGPGAILILANGLWMSTNWGPPPFGFLNIGWLLISLALFVLSGVIWFYLIYLQECLIQATLDDDRYLSEFKPLIIRWYLWGSMAIILPLVSMSLMVLKPVLFVQ
ncbi:MAG: DUF2269 family protein [Methylophagaceae bacterium]